MSWSYRAFARAGPNAAVDESSDLRQSVKRRWTCLSRPDHRRIPDNKDIEAYSSYQWRSHAVRERTAAASASRSLIGTVEGRLNTTGSTADSAPDDWVCR